MKDDDALRTELRALVGADGVLTEGADTAPFLVDERRLYRGRALAVALPRTVEQVARVVGWCNEHRLGLVPQGGNTGYCGGATPDESGRQLLLSLRRLNRIRAIDADNFSITAEAGCVLASVQQAADALERFFPLSLGSEGSCQIGAISPPTPVGSMSCATAWRATCCSGSRRCCQTARCSMVLSRCARTTPATT